MLAQLAGWYRRGELGRFDHGGGERASTTPFDRRPGIEQLGLRLTRLARSSRRESSRGDGTNAKLDSRPSAITGPRPQAPIAYCISLSVTLPQGSNTRFRAVARKE